MTVFKKTVQKILWILMGVQILMGICYIVDSFQSEIQQFNESIQLYRLGMRFISDDYTGILYPALLSLSHLFSGGREVLVKGATVIPFSAFFFVLQIACALAAAWYLLGVWMPEKKSIRRWYGALFLTTVPYLLQMHMAILTQSLSFSALLAMLGSLLRVWKTCEEKEAKKWIYWTVVFYLLAGLLSVENFWIGGLFLAVNIVFILKADKVFKKRFALVAVIAAVGILSLNGVTRVHQSDRIQNSFGAAMVSRMVWPNFATNYFFWSDDVKAVMSEKDAVYVCEREDGIDSFFGPAMEGTYGRKKANQLYLGMAARCLQDRTKAIGEEILHDFADYVTIPFTIEKNLQGQGMSLTAWNYSRMLAVNPEHVRVYFRFGYLLLPVMVICSLVLVLSKRFKQHLSRESKVIGFFGLWWAVWYTMASNKPVDYKLAMPIVAIWFLAAMAGTMQE